jgi:endonuclease/exonuclease/phosphatase family metal-dependent hydrolase
MKIWMSIFCFCFAVSSFASQQYFNKGEGGEFSLMTYNAENLFDTKHDAGKNDWTYLPLSVKKNSREAMASCHAMSNRYYREACFNLDWNSAVLNQKIQNIARVIKSYDNHRGPDIVVLQEVENLNVLNMLNRIGLKDEGYRTVVLLEGPDRRGIDVGILSRFPLVGRAMLHPVKLGDRETRAILEAKFKVHGHMVTVFGNHWPSQHNSDEDRLKAAKVLHDAARNVYGSIVIAAGDFNTADDDNPHGIESYITNERRHYHFYDGEEWADRYSFPVPGSHWYKDLWEKLDRIFIAANNVTDKIVFFPKSYRIFAPSFAFCDWQYTDSETGRIVTVRGTPCRYNAETGKGYSDHLPVTMKFEF